MLKLLTSLNTLNKEALRGRAPFNETVMVSATTPLQLDYRNRKHIYIQSGVALTLSLEDIGQATVPANVWTDISYQPGMYLFAVGQATNVPVRIRQTDETLAPNTNGVVTPINLTQILGAAIAASNPLFVAQTLGGSVLSGLNPEPNISNIQQLILNAQGFTATSGQQPVATAGNFPCSFFTPTAATKNRLLYSIVVGQSNTGTVELSEITSDPAYGTNPSYFNNFGGGAASSLGTPDIGFTTTTQTAPAANVLMKSLRCAANQSIELLTGGQFIYLPKGAAGNGIGVTTWAIPGAASIWTVTWSWLEL